MKRSIPPADKHSGSVLDRVACAVFSGVTGLIIGAVVWFWMSSQAGDSLPFSPVVVFSAVLAALGFALQDNVVANIIGVILEAAFGGRRK